MLIAAAVATGIGILANWVERPAWMTKPRLAFALVSLVVITALVQVAPSLMNTNNDPPLGDPWSLEV